MIAYDGVQEFELVKKLEFVRVAGTYEEQQAARIITEALEHLGLKPHSEAFETDAYQILEAKLEVLEPYAKEYTVTGYGLSGNAPAGGVVAPLLYAEDGDEISLSMAKGKIVLLNAAVSQPIYRKLVENGALGFLTISGTCLDDIEKTDLEQRALRTEKHLQDGKLPKLPGLTIRYRDAEEILSRGAESVRLTLQQREYRAPSQNIVAEIQGTEVPSDVVVFTAHYDSVPFSCGSYDNASGCALILSMCRFFCENPPKRTVRSVFCGAEEKGLVGSREYVKAHAEELKNIKLVVNVDLAGPLIGSHHAVVSADHSLCSVLEFMAKEQGFGIHVHHDVFSSDSSSFADVGVPAMSFYRGGFPGCHTRNDTLQYVSAQSLGRTAAFLHLFAARLVNSKVFPVPGSVPKEIQEKLDVYFGRKEP